MKKQKKTEKPKHVLRFITNFMLIVVLALFVINYAADPITQDGYSMQPVLQPKSIVFVNHLEYRVLSPRRFDIVSYHLENDTKTQVKRIIGLPGEMIQIQDGEILINGSKITLPDSMGEIEIAGQAAESIVLGEDEYFVLGDNPARSEDSRFESVGLIAEKQIDGKVWFYINSVSDFGLLK